MKKSLLLFLLSFLFFQVSRAQVIASFITNNCDTITGQCKPSYGSYNFYDASCLQETDIFTFGNSWIPENGWTEIKSSADNLTKISTLREWDGVNFVRNNSAPLKSILTNTLDANGHVLQSVYTDYRNPNPLNRTTKTVYYNIYDDKQRFISGVTMVLDSTSKGALYKLYERHCGYDAEGYTSSDDFTYYSVDGKITSKSSFLFSRNSINVPNGKSSIAISTSSYFVNGVEQISQSKDSTFLSADGLSSESYYFYKYSPSNIFMLNGRNLNTTDNVSHVNINIYQNYQNGQFVNSYKNIATQNYYTFSNWKNNTWVLTSKSDITRGCNRLDGSTSNIPPNLNNDVTQLKFTPNPASSYVYLQNASVNNIGDGLVRVFNTVGQLIKTEKVNYLPYYLDVSTLTSGTYILTFTGNSSNVKQKIFIQN